MTFLVFYTISTSAQKNGIIQGVLTDSAKHKNVISLATISVYKVNDTTVTAFGLSDAKGNFKISGIPVNSSYKIVFNSWQYKTLRKEITITSSKSTILLDTVYLSGRTNLLDEIEIKGEVPPIIVRNDTIEFNAQSFKTLPTAFVEDLFKKLPGFEMLDDGTVRVNGRGVSRILVDGKAFFGDNQAIATKQLPANIVDKVQVMDDIRAKRSNPDLIPANTPQVINIKLKKDVKSGVFGKVYAGSGISRYETGGIFNLFRDTLQISVLGYGNNVNKSSFSMNDIQKIGGFERSGVRNSSQFADGSFVLDNVSFGGGDQGIQSSSGAGINFNTVSKDGVVWNGKYFFGYNKSFVEKLIDERQELGVDKFNSSNQSSNNSSVSYHNVSGKLEWEPNQNTSLSITPSFTYSPGLRNYNSNGITLGTSPNLINTASSNTSLESANTAYSLYADFYKGFKKRGRTLSSTFSISNSNKIDEEYNYTALIFNNPNNGTITDQFRDNSIRAFNTYLNLNYSEPLNKKLTLSSTINSEVSNRKNALSTFYKNPLTERFDIIVPIFSETVEQDAIRMNIRTRLRWAINPKFSLQPALALINLNINNRFIKYASVKQNYTFFLPALNMRYNNLSFDYSTSFSEPNIQFIQPVLNNTDPLFVQEGNVNLLPTKNHQFSGRYSKYNPKTQFTINIFSENSIKENSIIMSRKIEPNGVQTIKPINIDNAWQASIGMGSFKNFKRDKNRYNISFSFNTALNNSFIEVNSIRSKTSSLSISTTIGGAINLKDKFELTEYYSPSYNLSNYQDVFFRDQNYLTHTSTTSLIFRYSSKLVIDSKFQMVWTNQNIQGYNNNINLLGAGVTCLFLKNNKGQLRFSVNDILQSNVKRNILITESLIRNTQTNNLGRYFLLSFNYNIQNFGNKKAGKSLLGL